MPSSFPYMSAEISFGCRPPHCKLTLVYTLRREQHITIHSRPPTHDRVTLPHVPEIGHELPDARVGDSEILDVDCGEGETGAGEEGGSVGGIWSRVSAEIANQQG